jgi:hypothetical protein
MIVVNINAGLANKMFHYAFGRGLTAKGLQIYYDTSSFIPRKEWTFEDITLKDAFPNIELREMPPGRFKWGAVDYNDGSELRKRIGIFMRKMQNLIGKPKYIFEERYGYIDGMETKASKDCLYRGFWQSEKYFKHCEEDVRKQFTFLPFDESKNIATAEKMSNENSVAIHFRKGKDYLKSELMGNGLCPIEYYESAIDFIKKRVQNPTFYVFTDNPEWVKENLNSIDYTLVDWNSANGKRSFRDMQLMTYAKHNIIANSTYSWWGAWLNPNKKKIVIAPKKFFNPINDFFASSNIVCEDWVAL